MTTIEAGGRLYAWFAENDSFSMEKDFIKIISITDEPSRDRAAFLIALGDLAEAQVVSSSTIEDTEYWVLKKPYSSYEQTLTISPDLAMTIAMMINKFCEIIEDETETCDPMNIKESDIKNLIGISNLMMAKNKDIDMDVE